MTRPDAMLQLRRHLTPTAGLIGASLVDFDLRQLASPAEFAQLKKAIGEFGVIFAPAQHLDRVEQIALASGLGPLAPSHPWLPPLGDHDAIRPLVTGARDTDGSRLGEHRRVWRRPRRYSEWHADVTPVINPPRYNVLCADTIPTHGGDTTWASTTAAYAHLSPPLQRLVDDMDAEHRYLVGYVPLGVHDAFTATVTEADLVATHPVVRLLPESGERALFVNPSFTSHIEQLTPIESTALLDLLYYHMTQSEFTVRYSWRAGDVAIWDNARCLHAAPEDHELLGQMRRMYRVMTAGDVPQGIDGRQSTSERARFFTLGQWH